MPRKDANPGQKEAAAARRQKAFDLRVAGGRYRDIGTQLGVSGKTAHDDVTTVLAELAAQSLASAADYVALECERLDMLTRTAGRVLQTARDDGVRLQAVDRLLRISESRRKLLGLDATLDTQLPGATTIIVQWNDQNRMLDVTPDHDHAAAIASHAEPDSAAPGAIQMRVRWAAMGQEPVGGDADVEDGAGDARSMLVGGSELPAVGDGMARIDRAGQADPRPTGARE